jgi:hypothetical protein
MPRAKQPNPANMRTDLLTPDAPGRAMEAPDQAQGRQTAQAQSQRILPIGTPAQPQAPSVGVPGAPAPAPQGPPAPEPGSLPWTDKPGPGGPPTLGLPNSAGPGPEATTGLAAQWMAQKQTEQGTLQSVLSHLASQPQASSLIRSLASAAGR